MAVHFPKFATAGLRFRADLYKWEDPEEKYTLGRWTLIDGTKPWYYAHELMGGLQWFTDAGSSVLLPKTAVYFKNLSPGSYKVRGHFSDVKSHWALVESRTGTVAATTQCEIGIR